MYVVAGVTGNTGSVVAELLLSRGSEVRVVVRDASKGEPWRAKGAEIAVASLDDVDALVKALAGAEGAYLLSPPDATASDFLALRRRTADAIAEAVDRARVPHVVFLSSIGAQHEHGTGVIESVHYAEQRLARTSAKTTFVRAAYFLENWAASLGAVASGSLPTFLPPDLALPMVSIRDIGASAAAALLAGPPPNEKTEIVELAGPDEWSSRDIAAVLAELAGRDVALQPVPLEAVAATLTTFGVAPELAALYEAMYRGIADGVVAWETGGARLVRGSVTAREALAKLLAHAAPAAAA